jgi:hypothetical protein
MRINPNAILLVVFCTFQGMCITYFTNGDVKAGALIGATTGTSIVTFFTFIARR